MSRNQKSPLILPTEYANTPDLSQPRQPAVVVDTPQGRLAFPQVAVAMISPDVFAVIGQFIEQRYGLVPLKDALAELTPVTTSNIESAPTKVEQGGVEL
jgi:hypothetical protein